MRRVCFFIGHRDAPSSLLPTLIETVEDHIVRYGVEEFLVGAYGAFDSLAVRAVTTVKAKYPAVTLTLLLPYHPTERRVPDTVTFDDTWYPSGMEAMPRRLAIVLANQRAVEKADYLITYVRHIPSNAARMKAYAEKHGVPVHNLED